MRSLSSVLLLAILAACSYEPQVTPPFDPRVHLPTAAEEGPRYTISYLPNLEGSRNRAAGISNSGWVAGFVNRPGNATRVAAIWRNNSLDTLGTLGGPNSIIQWPGIANTGYSTGITELAELDTLHEEWSCTAFLPSVTGHICRGFFWDGAMTAMPTQVPDFFC